MLFDNKFTSSTSGNNASIYQSILHQASFSFIIINQHEQIIEVNSSTEKLFGYNANEFEQLILNDILVFSNDSFSNILSLKSTDSTTKINAKGKRKNQELFRLEFSFISLDEGDSGIECYCLFFTELKEVGDNTKVKFDKDEKGVDDIMIRFIDNLPFVVFELTLHQDNKFEIGYVNKGMKIYSSDFDRDAINANNNLLFHRVHPDDKQLLIDSIKYRIPLENWEIEYRILDENGEIRWTKGYSKPSILEDGVTMISYICLQDITANKLAEEALIRERGLLRTMIDNLPVAVFVKDKYGRKLISNKIDLYFMGVRNEEDVLGKTDLELFNNKILFKGYEEDMHVLTTGKPIIEDPDITYNENGDKIDLLISKFPFKDDKGNIDGLIGIGRDITEKKRVEEQLKLVDFAFRNSAVSIFLVKEDGGFYDINEMSYRMLGYNRDELIKLSIFDINPNATKETWSRLWLGLQQEGMVTINSKGKKKDGTVIDVEIKSTLINYGELELNCAFVTDITEKMKALERLELADFIFREVSTPIIIGKEDGFFLDSNQAALELYGYTKEEMEKLEINDLTVRKHKTYSKLWGEVKAARQLEWESLHIKKDGTEINVECAARFFIYGGMELSCTFIVDITDRKKAELEKEQLVNELTQNNMELKQFSYITTHNLRAPLTNLITISKLLNTDDIHNKLTLKLIDGFKKSTFHLNETLNDLINILIIKENKNLAIGDYQFQKVLDKITESIESTIVNSRTIINADFSNAKEVKFNGAYLESIFLNLITNSIKYAAPNRDPVIIIKTEKMADNSVVLTFSDNGSGMNMNRVKHRIFGLYQRFHNNLDSKGIGLYLIHSQVTALGGFVKVSSEEGKGTIFTIGFK